MRFILQMEVEFEVTNAAALHERALEILAATEFSDESDRPEAENEAKTNLAEAIRLNVWPDMAVDHLNAFISTGICHTSVQTLDGALQSSTLSISAEPEP